MTATEFANVCQALRPLMWAVAIILVVLVVHSKIQSGAQPKTTVHR